MSRVVGMVFLFADALVSFLTLLTSSGTLLVVAFCLFSSLIAGFTSSIVRNTFWPSYFWDPDEAA